MKTASLLSVTGAFALVLAGCSDTHEHSGHNHDHSDHSHEHVEGHGHVHAPPNGGTPVVLGDEAFHIEFVAQSSNNVMEAYILDGHMDEYVRLTIPSFDVIAKLSETNRTLRFNAVTNLATGESVGDTALFRAKVDWLNSSPEFDAEVVSIEIRSNIYEKISFQFPKGNDPVHQH